LKLRTPKPIFETDVLPELLKALRKQVQILEATVEVLEKGQALVPPPTTKEVDEMREGAGPRRGSLSPITPASAAITPE
jgi:hypothetical protein